MIRGRVAYKMELYAAGFNSHQQLLTPALEDGSAAPNTLKSFTLAHPLGETAATSKEIKVLGALWGASVLLIDGVLEHRGYSDYSTSMDGSELIQCEDVIEAKDIKYCFGNEKGFLGAVHEQVGLLVLDRGPADQPGLLLKHPRWNLGSSTWVPKDVKYVSMLSDGKTCAYMRPHISLHYLLTFPSFASMLADDYKPKSIDLIEPLDSLQAAATAFIALQCDGQVLTFCSKLKPALVGLLSNHVHIWNCWGS